MGDPALSVRWRRFWRLFRTEQPRAVQVMVAIVAAVLVADLVALGSTGTSSTNAAVGTSQGTGAVAPGIGGGGSNGAPGSGPSRGSGGRGASGSSGRSGGAVGGGSAGVGTGSGGTSAGGGTAGGGSGSSGGGSGSGASGTSGALANLGNGVSSTSIKVVFPWPNVSAVEQAIGLYGSSEDPTLSIQAAVDAINAAGGINGRKIDPEIVQFNPLDDASMRADCLHWTQDEHVFAVVDADAWHDDNQLCITQENHTPLISSWTTVSDWTSRGAPNLWWTAPSANTVLDNLVAWARAHNYLAPGVKFGVVAADREGDTLSLASLDQSLRNVGLKPADTGSMQYDLVDAGTAQVQARDIVTRFNTEGIHTVIPLLPYTDFLYFVEAAKEQSWVPRWLISDYEQQNQTVLGLIDPSSGGPFASELNNSLGPTFLDLGNCDCGKPLPIGYDAFGAQCNANFGKYSGAAWRTLNKQQTGNDWSGDIETTGTAMTWCTNIDIFAAAARAVPPDQLTQAAFDHAMAGLVHFQGQLSPDYAFGPGRYAGPHEYRVVEEHVNSDNACPVKVTGGTQGDCWIIKQDFEEATHT